MTQSATDLLRRAREGDVGARDQLLDMLYSELRRIAGVRMAQERANHTLQPTALVGEAYMRLFKTGSPEWQSTDHFLGIAARTMRQILVDHARAKGAEKRGGAQARVTLTDAVGSVPFDMDIIDLHDALKRLEKLNESHARVIDLRYFWGLKVSEVAAVLDCSEKTIKNHTRFALAWLRGELEADESG